MFKEKFIALNAQVNASNIGYHTLQKYKNINAIIINETKLRHEMRSKKDDINLLSRKLITKLNKKIYLSQGENGAFLINNKNNKFIECPAFKQCSR